MDKGQDVLVLFRDWRKRLLHNVLEYRFTEDYVGIIFEGEEVRATIPMDSINYIGPPEPWNSGGVI